MSLIQSGICIPYNPAVILKLLLGVRGLPDAAGITVGEVGHWEELQAFLTCLNYSSSTLSLFFKLKKPFILCKILNIFKTREGNIMNPRVAINPHLQLCTYGQFYQSCFIFTLQPPWIILKQIPDMFHSRFSVYF